MLSGLARRAASKSRKHQYFTPLSVDSRTVSLTRPVQESEWERTSARPDSHRVTPPLQSGCMRVAAGIGQLQAAEHATELSAPGTHVTNVSQRAQIRPSPTHQHRSSSALRQPNKLSLTIPDPCWWQTAGEGAACHSEWCSIASVLPCPRRSRRPTWAGTVR